MACAQTDAATLRGGRSAEQFRNIFMKTGVTTQAAGSAYVELGSTKVVCSVHGPRQKARMQFSEEGRVSCELRFAAFASPSAAPWAAQGQQQQQQQHAMHAQWERVRQRTQREEVERELAAVVAQSIEAALRLHTFPKSVVDLNVLVLQDDGGVLGAACAGCCMALADAGIEMSDLVAACTIVVDPCGAEEEAESGGLMVTSMPSLNEITQIYQYGELSHQDIAESVELCLDGCSKVYDAMREILVAAAKKKAPK
eukprot:m51a1_g14539 putative 3 exoribonuclease domain 1 domain containing protein (255) ;mRNA; r:953739-955243